MITDLHANKANLSAITVTNISQSFTYKMAAKNNWHRYGTKLRHCHPVYCPGPVLGSSRLDNAAYTWETFFRCQHRPQTFTDLNLIHTATPNTSASAVWIGFRTTQDCRRQKIWILDTIVAIVQFTPPYQIRQDCRPHAAMLHATNTQTRCGLLCCIWLNLNAMRRG